MDIKIPVLKISDTVYRTFISNTLMEQIAMEGISENGSAPYTYWEFAERLSREVIPVALEEIVTHFQIQEDMPCSITVHSTEAGLIYYFKFISLEEFEELKRAGEIQEADMEWDEIDFEDDPDAPYFDRTFPCGEDEIDEILEDYERIQEERGEDALISAFFQNLDQCAAYYNQIKEYICKEAVSCLFKHKDQYGVYITCSAENVPKVKAMVSEYKGRLSNLSLAYLEEMGEIICETSSPAWEVMLD